MTIIIPKNMHHRPFTKRNNEISQELQDLTDDRYVLLLKSLFYK